MHSDGRVALKPVHPPVETLTIAIAVAHSLARTLLQIFCHSTTTTAHFIKWDLDALCANESCCVVRVIFSRDNDQHYHLHALVIDRKDKLATQGVLICVNAEGVESREFLADTGNAEGQVDKFGKIIIDPGLQQPPIFFHDSLKNNEAPMIPSSGAGDFQQFESTRSQCEYGKMSEFLINNFEKMLETLGSTHILPECTGCDNAF